MNIIGISTSIVNIIVIVILLIIIITLTITIIIITITITRIIVIVIITIIITTFVTLRAMTMMMMMTMMHIKKKQSICHGTKFVLPIFVTSETSSTSEKHCESQLSHLLTTKLLYHIISYRVKFYCILKAPHNMVFASPCLLWLPLVHLQQFDLKFIFLGFFAAESSLTGLGGTLHPVKNTCLTLLDVGSLLHPCNLMQSIWY
jgi:hypothetical protein